MLKNNFWLKLALEGLALFLSIMAAFWMEDYRVEKQEKSEYIANLSLFREEVHADIKLFLRPIYLDSVLGKTDNDNELWVIRKLTNLLSHQDSLPKFITENSYSRSSPISRIHTNSFISRSSIELYKYNSFLIKDSLVKIVWSYQAQHSSNQEDFEKYDKLVDQINEIVSNLDFMDPYNIENIKYHNSLVNKFYQLESLHMLRGIRFDLWAGEMVTLTRMLDEALFKYGIDTTSLDHKNIEHYNEWVRLRDSGN